MQGMAATNKFIGHLAAYHGDLEWVRQINGRINMDTPKEREGFVAFLPRFGLADSGGSSCDDVAQISHLKRSIDFTM